MHRWCSASHYTHSLRVAVKGTGIFLGTVLKCLPQDWPVSLGSFSPVSEKLRTYCGRLINRKTAEQPAKWEGVLSECWIHGWSERGEESGPLLDGEEELVWILQKRARYPLCPRREIFWELFSVSDALKWKFTGKHCQETRICMPSAQWCNSITLDVLLNL